MFRGSRGACRALLFLLLAGTGSAYEEKNISCPDDADDAPEIPSTAVCDGTVDCVIGSTEGGQGLYDESPDICAALPYLEKEIFLESREVTSTSAQVFWSAVTRHVPGHKLKLAGYFLSGKSVPHSFQNSISARLSSYQLQWMKPWTDYKIILRPFYTESGKPESKHKLGRAALVTLRTLPSEPEAPSMVSVVFPQQRNVVVNIVGPSAWNSEPVGFHVRWQATTELRGPQGSLDIALPSEWSPEENVLNITLPLQGGMDYRLSIRAVGKATSGVALQGTEVEVNASIPLDSCEVSATVVDSSKVVITWRASELVGVFKLTVYRDDDDGNLQVHTTRNFEGKEKVTSRHNVIITKLQPWSFYVARLEGCTGGVCSDAVNTTFSTPPEDFPSPSLTRVEATGIDSFQVAWQFPQRDRRVYEGFRVRYCPSNIVTCFLVYTKEQNLTVQGLEPGTSVSIEAGAQFAGGTGKLFLGPLVTASITTWSDAPDAWVWNEASIEDGTSLLSWACYNGSVDYLQYTMGELEGWTTCDDSADCDATVIDGRTAAFTTGDLRLTHQKQEDFDLCVHCCNSYACGKSHCVRVSAKTSEPPSLYSATVAPSQQGAVIRYVPHISSIFDGLEVTWNCNGDKKVTHQATFYHSAYDYITEQTIEGLSIDARKCEVFVSLFRYLNGGRYYSNSLRAAEQ